METHTAHIVREGLSFGENPRWHEGRLWYSDFYRHGIYSMDAAGEEQLEHFVLTQPSGLGWLADGDLLCVSMTDHKVLRFSGAHASSSATSLTTAAFGPTTWSRRPVVSPTWATSASTLT